MTRKKILLIEPPFYRLFKNTYSLSLYPLSLGYLAAVIKTRTDWDVAVYNADFSEWGESWRIKYIREKGFKNYLGILNDANASIWKEIKRVVESYKPDVVGISIKSQNFATAKIIAKIVKDVNPGIFVIAGGPHASMDSEGILSSGEFQFCVRGEGEETFLDLIKIIEKRRLEDLNNILGISYSLGDRIYHNNNRQFIKDLDALPFPHQFAQSVLRDYEKYPLSAFRGIFATRGCPYSCFFCGSRLIWGQSVRYRSIGNIVEEIKSLQKMGLDYVHFEDDSFGINKQYTNELCLAIKESHGGLKWSCEMNAKSVNEDLVSAMKASGCYEISLGIESGNDEILNKISKGITVEQALSAYRIIKSNRILLTVFFIIGFPWDNLDTINDTFSIMKAMSDSIISYSIFTPYPGTDAYKLCREKGLIKEPFDVSLYNHQSPMNNFCLNLTPDKFRRIAKEIEDFVDKNNLYNGFKRFFIWDFKRKITRLSIVKITRELRAYLYSLGLLRKRNLS